MKALKESLKESVLSNVEDGLINADNTIKELSSFGGKLELEQIYGIPEVPQWGVSVDIKNNINGLKPYSKNIDKVIDRYRNEYGDHNFMTQEKELRPRAKAGIERFITYLENVKLNDPKIDFNDVNTKKVFLSELNTMMHNDGSLDSKAEVYFETHYGGDRKGIFQISLSYKYERIVFLYKIK
jgi:hypothetical protein